MEPRAWPPRRGWACTRDTRPNNPPPHSSTRTRFHAWCRASFRTQKTTRLLGLSSAVGVHPSRARAGTLELKAGGRLKGGGSVAQKLSLGCCSREIFQHVNNTAHRDTKHYMCRKLLSTHEIHTDLPIFRELPQAP